MHCEFSLTEDQLCDVVAAMSGAIQEGLVRQGAQVACLPTFVPKPSGQISGKAVVVDLGGTNVRSALVEVEGGRLKSVEDSREMELPLVREQAIDRERFFGLQAELAAWSVRNCTGGRMPVGYCFSFPADPQADGDAVLLRWTKGVVVPGTVGQKVGTLLLSSLSGRLPQFQAGRIAVINDTVASLFASTLNSPEANVHIGLIVGTGTNMATFMPSTSLLKLSSDIQGRFSSLPVNFESGNFHPPHLSSVDDDLDESSINAGSQRFEKAVSGAYLGGILRRLCSEAGMSEDAEARDVVKLVNATDATDSARVCARAVLDRSADLVAAGLVAATSVAAKGRSGKVSVGVLAEGSLFWKAPGYSSRVHKRFVSLAGRLGIEAELGVGSMEHANLLGTAVAALTLGHI